jgi:Domain of unknown function (DUF4062)
MKVFISSTYEDLIDYRTKTAEAVERLGQQGVRMEVFGARPQRATEVCRDEIVESDIFVGIYAHRYGYIPPGGDLSITEMEYHYAVEHKKPVFCFVVDEDHPWRPASIEGEPAQAKLKALKEKISSSLVRDTFTTPEDLAFKVAASVGRYLIAKAMIDSLKPGIDSLEALFAKSAPGGHQIDIIARVFEGDSLLAEKVFTNISATNAVGSPVEFKDLRIEIVAHPVGGGASRQAKISI